MRYLYAIGFSFLTNIGVWHIINEQLAVGIIVTVIGALCWIINIFWKKFSVLLTIASIIIIGLSSLYNFVGSGVNASEVNESVVWHSEQSQIEVPIKGSNKVGHQAYINGKIIDLKIIAEKSGNESDVLKFSADKSPVVIIWEYEPTSNIKSDISISYQYGEEYGSKIWTYQATIPNDSHTLVIDSTGKMKVRVESVGCNWNIKAGVESK